MTKRVPTEATPRALETTLAATVDTEPVRDDRRDTEKGLNGTNHKQMAEGVSDRPTTYRESLTLCFQRRYRRSVILGLGVPICGQLAGINVMSGYTTIIFEDAGFDKPVIASALFGFVDIIGSVVAVALFDRAGRKTMAGISFSGMALSYLGAALADLSNSRFSSWMAVVCVNMFVFFFGAGGGSLLVAYAPEVVPPEIADVVLGVGQASTILVSLMLVLLFPSLLESIGALWSFLILCFFCAASLLFLMEFMVETKGKELKDILAEIQR